MIIYDYEYDLVNQPFFSRIIDQNNSVVLKFLIPDGVKTISGMMIKLNKAGNPGDILYCLRRDNEIITKGNIDEKNVTPVLELFVEIKFNDLPVEPGMVFYLELKAENCEMPLDGYRIFGPRQDENGCFDEAETIPYWWEEKYCCGMEVPKEYKTAKYDKSSIVFTINEDDSEGPGVSFGLITGNEVPAGTEQRFEFIRKLVAEPYSEWHLLDNAARNKCSVEAGKLFDEEDNEVLLDSSWGLRLDDTLRDSALLKNIIKEINAFFIKVFGFELNGADKFLTLKQNCPELPRGSESHLIKVDDKEIVLSANNERGLLRAVHYIEEVMLEKQYQSLQKGIHLRESRYELRMANGIYPAPFNYYTLQSPEIWTDGYMWRLSRAGYNAVWVSINLEEIVTDSKIFPEMNDAGAETVIERLRRIMQKASEYGVDVYFEIKTGYFKWFSDKVFKNHPELKSFNKWGNYPCTGHEVFERFLEETLGNTLSKVPRLKGIIIIYDSEGFYSCFANEKQEGCPICKAYGTEELALRFLTNLKKVIEKHTENGELIAWTYYCDSEWNYKLMKELPPEIRVMSCYSQFVDFERFGVGNTTDDYACCVTGPSDYFSKVYDISRLNGRKVMAKTEVSLGQEFVGIPYVPCLTQHQKRWDSMAGRQLYGFMGDYIHRGFVPSPCTDLMRINSFTTEVNGKEWLKTDEKLKWIASLNFGKDAAEDVVRAWELFSEAMSGYFPYSPEVCRYPGPLQSSPGQPFYMDRERKIKRKRARYNVADLSWTKRSISRNRSELWNEKLVSKCFIYFNALYEKGVEHLENAIKRSCDSSAKLQSMANIAKIQICMVRSIINFIDFISLRDGTDLRDKDNLSSIKNICSNELENAALALQLCEADSNLGFSCEGQGTVRGGYFTPATIKEKIRELEETLKEIQLA